MKTLFAFVNFVFLVHFVQAGEVSYNETLGMDAVAECRDYHSIPNTSLVCDFIRDAEDCQMDGGFINYIYFSVCEVKPNLLPAVYVLYALWLILLFIAIGTTAESFFCPALEFIAHNLRLSHNIAGITVVAFGNGAPDLFSAIAAFKNSTPGSSSVAIGALLGAGVFVTTVVAGAVSVSSPLELAQRPFLRDLTFYIFTVFWTFCLLYYGKIDLRNSIGFLLLYVGYVAVVLIGRSVNQWLRRKERAKLDELNENERSPLLAEVPPAVLGQTDENGDWIDQPLRADVDTSIQAESMQALDEANASSDDGSDDSDDDDQQHNQGDKWFGLKRAWYKISPIRARKWHKASVMIKILLVLQAPIMFPCNLTVPVVSAKNRPNDWSRTLSCIHCVLTPVFCVFAARGGTVYLGGKFPLWALFLIIGVAAAVLVRFTSKENIRPPYYWVFAYIGFASSIIWTYGIANEIVNLLRTFGAMWDVSNVIMGLTLLAMGNSIGDMVADVTLARQGFPRMAISACFGGPFFNLIIGIGLPCTIATISSGAPLLIKFTAVEAVLAGSLLFSLCLSFIVLPFRRFRMDKAYGILLIVLYVLYLPIVLLFGTGVIG